MPLNAFQQRNPTKCIAASSAGSVAVQVSTGGEQGMFISNPTTSPIYWIDGKTSATTAAFPTTSTAGLGMCIPAGLAGPFVTDPGGWLSVATSAGSANIFATPGFGQ
jgi:hypothetical protein